MYFFSLDKKNYSNKILFYLIYFLPISLIVGSLILNLNIVLINIFFLLELIKQDKIKIFKNWASYLFLSFVTYLCFASFFISEDSESLIKSFGLLRYFILSLAIGYCIKNFKFEKILNFWFIIFSVVSFDILFEFTFGSNLLGFKSAYHGRVASFTGDELIIGGFYFGFISIILSLLINKKYFFPILTIIFLIVSLLIGERANFLKVIILVFLYVIFIYNISFKKKIFLILISIILVFSFLFSSAKLSGRFYLQFSNKDFTIIEGLKNQTPHYSHYITSIKIFKDFPIFGIGLKNFRNISHQNEYNYNEFGYGGGHHPHQTHLEILTETGIAGYLLIMSFLIYSILLGIKQFFHTKNAYLGGSIIFIAVTLLPLIPSGSFFTTYTATLFWINYGFLLGNSKIFNLK